MFTKNLNDISYRLRHNALHKISTDHYLKKYFDIPRLDSKERVVVSFTTLPDRIEYLSAMINSLLSQTRRPDAIYLCVPEISQRKKTRYVVPQEILNNRAITIITADKDYGPATKLIPAFLAERKNPDTKIIIVDDDQVYPRYHLECLNNWANLLPNSAVGGAGCFMPDKYPPSKVLGKDSVVGSSLRLSADKLSYLTQVDILFGYASYVVRPRFLNDQLLDYSGAPTAAFFEDDVWVSGNLARNGVDRYAFPCLGKRFSPASSKKTRHTGALCTEENVNYQNMDIIYDYFREYW